VRCRNGFSPATSFDFFFVRGKVLESLCSHANPLLEVSDCNLIIILILPTSYNSIFGTSGMKVHKVTYLQVMVEIQHGEAPNMG
jgi:hypothetical protein